MTTTSKKARKNRKPAASYVAPAPEAEVVAPAVLAETPAPETEVAPAPAETPAFEAILAPAEAPAPEAEVAPVLAEAPAPETEVAPAEAAPNPAEVLADLQAKHAEIFEAIRQTKLLVKAADKAAFRAANPKRMTGLDAAYEILKGFPHGLNVKAILKRAYERELWRSPAGYTPESTIHAAISREIRAKGKNSRFAKGAKKGLFIVNPEYSPA